MKVTIEFCPYEDREELEHAQNGSRYFCFMQTFEEWMRRREESDEPVTMEEIRIKYYTMKVDELE